MEKKMVSKTFLNMFNGTDVTLLGAGVSNIPLIDFLLNFGADVTVRDQKKTDEIADFYDKYSEKGVKFICGDDYLKSLSGKYIFRSPGIRPDLPEINEAVASGSILLSEIRVFLENVPCPVIGVTGSDGKTTTSTLASKILSACSEPGTVTYLGGNIGKPLLNRILFMQGDDSVVAELSSFQLIDCHEDIDTAVITNISPNHLNWHKDMDEYVEAKKHITEHSKNAILNYNNEYTREIAKTVPGELTFFSADPIPEKAYKNKCNAVFLRDGEIFYYDKATGKTSSLVRTKDILIPGKHNIENYMAASAAVISIRGSVDSVAPAVRKVATSFNGVEHRLETVGTKNGVRYINSSIDTTPTRTAAAVSAMKGTPLNIILGGSDKNLSYVPLAKTLLDHGGVKRAVVIGATQDKIYKALTDSKELIDTGIEITKIDKFKDAFEYLSKKAQPGECVLLSPACASFDQFPNFETRGDRFRELVADL